VGDHAVFMRLVFISMMLMTAACSSSGSKRDYTEAQPCTGDISKRAIAEGVAIGAAGGSALGAGAGQLIDRDPLIGAAVGGGVGAMAGLLYAISVENQYQQAQCQEFVLDKAIEIVQKMNQESLMLNQSLTNYLSELSKKIMLVTEKKHRTQANLDQIKSEKAKLFQVQFSVAQNINATNKLLAALHGWRLPMSSRSQSLSMEISRLEAQNEELQGHAQSLARLGQLM